MKMSKVLVNLLIIIALCGFVSIANAGIMEDIKKSYPSLKIKQSVVQNNVGAEINKKEMIIYKTQMGFSKLEIRLLESNDKNSVCLDFIFFHKRWAFIDHATIGNGKDLIVLTPNTKPTRYVKQSGSVFESFLIEPTLEELKFMKNTKVMRLQSEIGPLDINFKTTWRNHVPYYEAIDYAIKFLEEQ